LTEQSSNPCAIGVAETSPHGESGGYWIARSSRAMTANWELPLSTRSRFFGVGPTRHF
jgi:hypothetical protein